MINAYTHMEAAGMFLVLCEVVAEVSEDALTEVPHATGIAGCHEHAGVLLSEMQVYVSMCVCI